jgi:hypothetical protein
MFNGVEGVLGLVRKTHPTREFAHADSGLLDNNETDMIRGFNKLKVLYG